MEEEEQERDSQHFGPKAWPCLGNRCPHENIKGFLSKQGQENGRGGGHNYVQHPRSQNKDKIAAAAARQQQRRRANSSNSSGCPLNPVQLQHPGHKLLFDCFRDSGRQFLVDGSCTVTLWPQAWPQRNARLVNIDKRQQ